MHQDILLDLNEYIQEYFYLYRQALLYRVSNLLVHWDWLVIIHVVLLLFSLLGFYSYWSHYLFECVLLHVIHWPISSRSCKTYTKRLLSFVFGLTFCTCSWCSITSIAITISSCWLCKSWDMLWSSLTLIMFLKNFMQWRIDYMKLIYWCLSV